MNNLNERLKNLREANNLSQEEVASRLKISRQSISKWELGDSIPDIEKLTELSKIYGVSLDYLVGNSKSESIKINEQILRKKRNALQVILWSACVAIVMLLIMFFEDGRAGVLFIFAIPVSAWINYYYQCQKSKLTN
ncbi:helix-turn-helix domain-containing protein [Lactobacillus mulieris]|uniref:Helix-turn-helix domain-containing protein n=1 Tax=Lactobacillus mulieris TaxID=2508708 RepID=A0AAW5X0V1_9LACO|nr:helix-turn-helix domain-containing protein [Lactobacillus mulieris]MCZ3622861.1 helix-turn-helix domain-containing protein [Lactobacillus mulieris]MCZ3624548.1 helix-turn-helix domain-containing protein [Lactobacillus mulieris]MCZ3636873.1 helix-turn-helix domain-containing protein [Lactobacillus mulieris]MCZ3690810.1 helix-turn-helix domain-containing protein [Lactobacillus mulieris]MCZ3696768.1 helix-turn-helix domain-containing protein [Lactobacillus mulieris]